MILRWHATIVYRSNAGLVPVEHDIEEIFDLHDLVEHGPDWDTIAEIRLERIKPRHPGLTVEQAERM